MTNAAHLDPVAHIAGPAPLAFVVGTGRCGSTMVHELVVRHPSVGFISNIDDKLSPLNLLGTGNGWLYRRMAPRDWRLRQFRDRRVPLERGRLRVSPSEGWNLLDRQVLSGFSRPCRDLLASDATPFVTGRVQGFFDARMRAQRSDVFLHKLTGWPRTGLLQVAYPQARVVHVVRDGRAVANSWLQMGWWDGYHGPHDWFLGELPPAYAQQWERSGRSFPVLAAIGWSLLMDAFDAARAAHPPEQWLDVRYEDVLARPRETVGRILDFLGLDWSAGFEAGFARHRFEPGRGVAYRKDLDEASVAAMEPVMQRQLRAWGYSPSAPQRGPSRPRTARPRPSRPDGVQA